MAQGRDRSRDGFGRRVRSFVLQNFQPFWRLIEKCEFLSRMANKAIINKAVDTSRNRPHQFSTKTYYTSWDSLTDKTYFGRHVRADRRLTPDASAKDVSQLFKRTPAEGRECPKSTMLFPVFAQYLTDGFLRTEKSDHARTTSNHEIDLSPLYGRNNAQTSVLREDPAQTGRKGRLKSQDLETGEYPPYLFEKDGTVRSEFLDDAGQPILDMPLELDGIDGFERQIFAVGGDRANSTMLISMINCLMLREHNRLAGRLESDNPTWDDERVFQTARNILIAIYIKLVIEDYINHISSTVFHLRADPRVAWKADWNRPNWMTTEFTLLYRWHSLIPNIIHWNGKDEPARNIALNNTLLVGTGLAEGFRSISEQNATAIDLFNTTDFLMPVELSSIEQARDSYVSPYNKYRDEMSFPAVETFEQITGDTNKLAALKETYGSVDAVEFFPGLFAEDSGSNSPMSPLLGAMVALDAFSQALTNPLLSEHVFNTDTFTEWGMQEFKTTNSVADLVLRNCPEAGDQKPNADDIRMTRKDWKRRWQPF